MLYDMCAATPLQSRPPHGFARIGRRGVTRYFDDDAALETPWGGDREIMLFLNIINHIVRQNPEVRQQLSGYNGLVVGVRTGSLHIVGRINAEGVLEQTHRAADCTLLLHQDALPQMMQGRMPDFNDVAIEGDMPLGMGILWRCAALRYSPHEDIRRLLGDENSRKTAQWAGRAGGVLQTAGQWLQQYADQMGEKQPAPAWQQQLDACRQEIEVLRRQLAERDERD